MRMTPAKKIEMLQRLLSRATQVKVRDSNDPTFRVWKHLAHRTLRNVFGHDSPELAHFLNLRFFHNPSGWVTGRDFSNEHRSAFDRAFQILIASINDYIEELQSVAENFESGEAASVASGSNVFIIHGHDLNLADAVARRIERRKLTAIILHEQANSGRTIIEKFEDHALPCAYAIALFTPDDEGRLKTAPAAPQPRARQNVVFELGYFVGALGRDRVAVLYSPDVEVPSDFGGVVYIPLDAAWRAKLDQELDAAEIGEAGATE